MGKREKALQILEERKKLSTQRYVAPLGFALIHLGLGDHEQALDWLERGYVQGDFYMTGLKTTPVWDPLRTHPRFQALLRRMNFPE